MFRKIALILMIGILTITGTAFADVSSNRSVGILYSDRGVITGVFA